VSTTVVEDVDDKGGAHVHGAVNDHDNVNINVNVNVHVP
jgi:hypothetical protein